MNRRGSLEWNLETVGKLVLYGLVLALIAWVTYELIMLFVRGNSEFVAKRNLDTLLQRIDVMKKEQQETGSVILAMPYNTALIGFDKGQESITYGTGSIFDPRAPHDPRVVKRPDSCTRRLFGGDSSACICIAQLDWELSKTGRQVVPEFGKCKRMKGDTISGTISESQLEILGPNIKVINPAKNPNQWPTPTYTLWLSGLEGPRVVKITLKDTHILIDART